MSRAAPSTIQTITMGLYGINGVSKSVSCTAVNGFGFVQIVRPRARASLVELAQDRPAFEARALLRRAAFDSPGPKGLVAHEGRAEGTEMTGRKHAGGQRRHADRGRQAPAEAAACHGVKTVLAAHRHEFLHRRTM